VVLGIGGVRALRALDIHPAVWHMNEGHVALLGLERARERVVRGEGLATALKGVAANTIFTTHTPVPAGNETFDLELVRRYVEPWARDVGSEPDAALRLGTEQGQFNLTALAIRLSSATNGVSQLHGEVSSEMWRHLWPKGPKHPISSITNGVHTESWIGPEMRSLYVEHLAADWETHLLDLAFWKRIEDVPPAELWAARRSQRERLIRFVRERLRTQGARHGSSPGELRELEALLDPHALTIGFARRFATYKRAVLLLTDLERLKTLLSDPDRPVQFIFAGKAHPADREGQGFIRRLFLLACGELQGKLVFLENYDIEMGRMLVGGCDVWLNTPRRPHEASGTSGQKVPINGGLNLSILDGWWAEGYQEDNGWAIGAGRSDPDPSAQDRADADSLYQLLEDEVIPTFYERDEAGLPLRWIKMMKRSIASIVPAFSARRMVREYAEELYLPAAERR
jgi:starch phosphorylase